MSDDRRRRKSQQSGGSDDLSDSYEELNATKETQSSEHTEDHHDPAYDAGNESNSESQDSFQDGEYNKRESGDGQEEDKPQKKLDDDEDRRNPQYIPKRGTFYEHDDRTAEEANNETAEPQPEREAKEKKVWKDKEDRWDHDRYNDEEQAPKSHAELIAIYGYDIRNEEGPPRARRRRKYGRGPNKYTRNWEDEDAYGKVAGTVPTNKPNNTRKVNRTGEEFPLLNPKDKDDSPKTEEQPVITSAWYSNKNKIHPNKTQNFPPLQTESQKAKPKLFTNSQANENKAPNERNNTAWKREPKNTPYIQNANNTTVATADTEKIVIVKTVPRENKRPPQVQESVSLASSKSRGRGFKANANNNIVGNRTIESKPKGRGPGPLSIPVDNRRSNVEHEQIINDMKHMNVSTEGPSYHHAARQNKHFYTQPSSQHSTVVPPRMQPSHPQQQPPPPQQPLQPQQPPPQQDIASNRPKRYSSLRQRPLIADGPPTPTQPNYQPAPQHTYYPPPQAGSSRAVLESPGYPPGPYEQTPAPAAPMGGQPVIPIPPGAQPASYAPHAPPPFLVPTPQFIPSQTAPPSIINYVAGPNGPIFQPNYQGYNPAAVQPGPPPPQEVGLYQPQGCTYYSPAQQQQQQQQQPVPLRRPKVAIPILPPPDNLQNPNNRGRPRSLQPQSQMPPQDPQQQQQLQQQQQQEQLVQQQLQQHQQQLIQEQQQERQQQEQLFQQQQQQKQQELQQQQQKQQELQQQQQKKQQEQQKQQQQEQPQKQLKQEQPQQPPKQEQPQQPLKQEQPQQSQQPEQKQIPESEQQQKPEQEQKQVPEQEQHVEKPEELKQEPQPEQSQKPQQEQPQKLQQEQQQEPLKKEQQEPQQKEQEKPQVQGDSNSDKSVSKPVETLETTIKTVDKIESVVNDDSSVLANTKDNLEQKLESIVLEDKSLKDSEEKLLEPVVTEAAVEQKETLTKVEVVIPDVIPNAVEEKITAPAITEVSLVMTTVLEEKTDKSVSNCVIESNAILASEEVKGVSTNTAELVSSKSETDCSIKESAVIEEAAA